MQVCKAGAKEQLAGNIVFEHDVGTGPPAAHRVEIEADAAEIAREARLDPQVAKRPPRELATIDALRVALDYICPEVLLGEVKREPPLDQRREANLDAVDRLELDRVAL